MDRLSVLDAEFLHLEDGIAHMHIAGISVFEPPVPSAGDLAGLLAAKLHLIPRYRQRVRPVPFELGRPVWVDDPHFNLDYHVRATALAHPGGDEALCRLMGRLMSQPLDRDRPLWESWIVEGLPDDRWALISKVHHCMVDGVSGVDLLTVLLDVERDGELPHAPRWRPAPEPSGPAKVADAWLGLAGDTVGLSKRLSAVVDDPMGALSSVGSTGQGLVRMGRHLGSTPPLSIEGSIGPHRVWAHSSASLDDVRRIRKSYGGTINDVVLAAVANGYRQLLASRDEEVADAVVRTLVPVSVRAEGARGTFDNRVSAILYELPVGIEDPVERLWKVEREMSALKASHMRDAGDLVTAVGNLAPPMLVGPLTRLGARVMHQLPQRSINTVTTNVPGPQFPLYCLGRRMLEYRPYVPISHGVRVGTAILSYDGNLAFGVTGDYDTAPDVDVLAQAISAGIDELRERAEGA